MALDDAIERVSVLEDPVRRAMYRYVRSRQGPVTRDEVAEGVGASRKLAAFHLDKLVAKGLLRSAFRPSGPAGGRPAKVYEPAPGDVRVTLPERRYDVVGEVLVDAVSGGGRAAERAALAAAREQGRRRAAGCRSLAGVRSVLEEMGYEPRDESGTVVLGNCPFHALAERARPLVCGLNLALLGGVVEQVARVEAVLEPEEGRCCVVLRRQPTARRMT